MTIAKQHSSTRSKQSQIFTRVLLYLSSFLTLLQLFKSQVFTSNGNYICFIKLGDSNNPHLVLPFIFCFFSTAATSIGQSSIERSVKFDKGKMEFLTATK